MAWPCVVEAVLLAMVNVVDTIMVGTLGTNAIAAVGVTGQPRFLLMALPIALNVGLNSVGARRKGEQDRTGANAVLKAALYLSAVLGGITALVGVSFARPMLEFTGAEAHYIDDAVSYFQIVALGLLFQIINLAINAVQRSVGNTKITMRTNVTSNVVNVIMNYILINGAFGFPKLGVRGAAIATLLGAIVAFAMAVVSILHRKGYINLSLAWKEKFNYQVIKPIFFVGSSVLVEQICTRIGFIAYAMMVINLGTVAYATHTICNTMISLSFSAADGIAMAAAALVGQRLGAKDVEGARTFGAIGQKIAFGVSTILVFIFFFGRYGLMGLYTTDQEVIALGANILIIMSACTHLQTSQIVYNGCLRGAGDSRYVALISLLGVTIVRPVSTYLFCYPFGFGVYGAWISLFLDQLIRVILAVRRFYGNKWSQINL